MFFRKIKFHINMYCHKIKRRRNLKFLLDSWSTWMAAPMHMVVSMIHKQLLNWINSRTSMRNVLNESSSMRKSEVVYRTSDRKTHWKIVWYAWASTIHWNANKTNLQVVMNAIQLFDIRDHAQNCIVKQWFLSEKVDKYVKRFKFEFRWAPEGRIEG